MKEHSISEPAYYMKGDMEVKDIIYTQCGLPYFIGNVIKYVCRFQYKDDPIKDLQKAKQFIDFIIEYINDEEGKKKLNNIKAPEKPKPGSIMIITKKELKEMRRPPEKPKPSGVRLIREGEDVPEKPKPPNSVLRNENTGIERKDEDNLGEEVHCELCNSFLFYDKDINTTRPFITTDKNKILYFCNLDELLEYNWSFKVV